MVRRYKGTLISPEKEGERGLFVYDIDHPFQEGDQVVDITAEENDWEDIRGVVIAVDGPHVKVRYESGNERAKLHINLRKL